MKKKSASQSAFFKLRLLLAIVFAVALSAVTEASSHTAAQTVTVFAKANIVASGDK